MTETKRPSPAECLTCDVKFHDQKRREPSAAAARIRDQLTSEITIKTIDNPNGSSAALCGQVRAVRTRALDHPAVIWAGDTVGTKV